jgi:hypothetical protein
VLEDRVLRKIFGSKKYEMVEGRRKLLNEERRNLYSSPRTRIIRMINPRRMRWAGHIGRVGEKRNAYRILVAEPEGKRPLGRPRFWWDYNFKMDLREVG